MTLLRRTSVALTAAAVLTAGLAAITGLAGPATAADGARHDRMTP